MFSKPVEHRLRSALKLKVTIPPGCRALNPLQFLVGYRDIVVHRLDVAGVGEGVTADLIEESWYTNFFCPLLRNPPFKPNAGAQAQQGVVRRGSAHRRMPRGNASSRRRWRLLPYIC